MARGRKKKALNECSLLKALRFIAVAQKALGSPEQTFCRLYANWAMASNGIISAATQIDEDLTACPHTTTLIDALEKAQESVNITQLDGLRLSVRAGEFQAVVPCLEPTPEALPTVFPDAPIADCDDRLRPALDIVGKLISESGQKIITAAAQFRNGTVLGTDGNIIIEAWHGIAFPPLMLAPKAFITALAKIDKPIRSVGLSESSLTLWFENNSWMKTQLYPANTELPDLYQYLNIPAQPVDVPQELFDVARKLAPFSEDGVLSLHKGIARVISPTRLTDATEATKSLPDGHCFSIKSLLAIEPYVKQIHFSASPGVTLWFGDYVRGAISDVRVK